MRIRKKRKHFIILGVLLLILGTGLAYLSANLTINGTSKVGNITWDVHFENARLTENTTVTTTDLPKAPANLALQNYSYGLTFDKPGEVFEFLIDVKNGGTIDAVIDSISSTYKIGDNEAVVIADDKSNLPTFLDYSLTYLDDTPLEMNHELPKTAKETIKVRIEFKGDISNEEFNAAVGKNFVFNMHLEITQVGAESDNWDTHPVEVEESAFTYDPKTHAKLYLTPQFKYTYYEPGTYDFSESKSITNFIGYDIPKSNTAAWIASPSISNFEGGWHVMVRYPESTDPITETILTSINGEPIISMDGTFDSCHASSVDLSNINTSKIIDMRGMFYYSTIPNIDVSKFDTRNVISMAKMFSTSDATTITGLEKFKTKNVINMSYMFEASQPSTLDLSSFDTSKVLDMTHMFYDNGYDNNMASTIYASNKFVTTGLIDLSAFYESDTRNSIFNAPNLVGGNGTHFSSQHKGMDYARIDAPGTPGYFTAK